MIADQGGSFANESDQHGKRHQPDIAYFYSLQTQQHITTQPELNRALKMKICLLNYGNNMRVFQHIVQDIPQRSRQGNRQREIVTTNSRYVAFQSGQIISCVGLKDSNVKDPLKLSFCLWSLMF